MGREREIKREDVQRQQRKWALTWKSHRLVLILYTPSPHCAARGFPDLWGPCFTYLLSGDKVKRLLHAKCVINGSGSCAKESHFEDLEVVPYSEHLYKQSLGFRQF